MATDGGLIQRLAVLPSEDYSISFERNIFKENRLAFFFIYISHDIHVKIHSSAVTVCRLKAGSYYLSPILLSLEWCTTQ